LDWVWSGNTAEPAVLVERIDPETGHAGYLEGEVGFEILFQLLALLIVHDVVDKGMHFTCVPSVAG
jgi:hypothetical protein